MSYEKKIRDLLGRLVAMSPEPPPYPEETPMATNEPPRRRAHPALVFAGAAALVAALAVPVILLTGDEPPVAGGTTTTTTVASTSTSQSGMSSTTTGESTTTSTPSTTTTVAATTWQGTVFLYQTPENSFLGNPALVPIALQLTDLSGELSADAPFTEALAALGPELPEMPADAALVNAVPADVRIVELSTTTVEGVEVWQADMNEAFLDGAGGLLADYTMLNQLIYTITYGEGSEAGVLFTMNDEPIGEFGSEGLVLTDPVNRDTFIDELGLIFLTEPLVEIDGVYTVAGRSNTFEAMLALRVIDDAGNTIHEEPVQATSGSGTWGEFGVGVDSDLVSPGDTSIQLFEYSAEDGSMVNVITVPIPANGVWEITTG